MARDLLYDIKIDDVGYILTDAGLNIQKRQANPYAMKSSTGERSYADLDEWAVFQVDTMHRGMGSDLYGDPEEYFWGINVDTRFKNKIMLGPLTHGLTTPANTGDVHYSRFGSKIFMSIDDDIYELVTTTWTLRESLTTACTALCEFNGYLYAAQGTGNTMRKSANGTAWTDVGDTPGAHRLYVHGGYLYRSLNQQLYYSADPDAGSPTWSSVINVGDSQYVVESMVTYSDALIVFKNDCGYKVPGNPGEIDQAYELGELKWRNSIDAYNGLQCCVWSDGYLYVTYGKGGILRWTGKTVSSMGPDLGKGEIKGRIWSLMPTNNFLYALIGQDGVQTSNVIAWNGSGWHNIRNIGEEGRGAYYFDPGSTLGGHVYVTTYDSTAGQNDGYRVYQPSETADPTEGPGDSNYAFATGGVTSQYIYTPKFTANLHDSFKEFKDITLWVENWGLSGTGTQQVRIDYRIDSEASGDWVTLVTETIEASVSAKKSYKTEFPISTFATKRASVAAAGRTITLTSGTTTDMAAGDWCFFVGNFEYRMVSSVTDSTHFEIQCPFDTDIIANTWMRVGQPWGRYIQFRISLRSSVDTRTPILRAMALKYLVNIRDYDIWTANIHVSHPRTLRNGSIDKHTPISTQFARLDESRSKGRVAFVDEMGDTHVVRVTNYSTRPLTQRTDKPLPEASYVVVATLLEV